MQSSKDRALKKFLEEIKKEVGKYILSVQVFGSVTKGKTRPESDIDVLIVYSNGISEWEMLEKLGEISFDIACKTGEGIEPVLMSEEEYKEGLGTSPFLWEVTHYGKTLYSVLKGTNWKIDFADYIGLASEYLEYARDALKDEKLRLVIDTAYNAAELLVKQLIIKAGEPLASSHGGVVGQFGRLYVLAGSVKKEIGKELHISLELRAKARYKPKAQLVKKDAEFVLTLAEKILSIVREQLCK